MRYVLLNLDFVNKWIQRKINKEKCGCKTGSFLREKSGSWKGKKGKYITLSQLLLELSKRVGKQVSLADGGTMYIEVKSVTEMRTTFLAQKINAEIT